MRRSRTFLTIMMFGLLGPTGLFASYMQDYVMNVNGTTYCPSGSTNGCSSTGGFAALSGLNSAGFNTSTGLGTLTLTFNPGSAGSYYVDTWLWDVVNDPNWNEYGVKNGSAAAGQHWQIDIPDYESDANFTGTIIANTKSNSLDNTNHLVGTTDNYNLNCGALGGGPVNSACNDSTSLAMGFSFSLTASEEEILTFTVSTTNPGGFSLEQIHPQDGNNPSPAEIFLSGTATTQPSGTPPPPPPPTSPEPATWGLMAVALASMGVALRKRFTKN